MDSRQRRDHLLGLLAEVSVEVAARDDRVRSILEETYRDDLVVEHDYGARVEPLRSPAGKMRSPVRFLRDPERTSTCRVEISDWAGGNEPIRVFERVAASLEIPGPRDARPLAAGHYQCVLRDTPQRGAPSRYFEVLAEEVVSHLPRAKRACFRHDDEDLTAHRLWAPWLEAEQLYCEAIECYDLVFRVSREAGVAARIAACYEALGLEGWAGHWTDSAIRAQRPRGKGSASASSDSSPPAFSDS